MQLSNVYQAAQFHHDLSAKPEQIRHNLTVAWKLLRIAEAARLNDQSTIIDTVRTLHPVDMETIWTFDLTRIYHRRFNAAVDAIRPYFHHLRTTRENDTALEWVLVQSVWSDYIYLLSLETGECIVANEVFSSNAEMYRSFATIKGETQPILSLTHLGL